MQPFAPRRVTFHGLRSAGDWRLKLFSIQFGTHEMDWESFAPGLELAQGALPAPAVTPERLGVGFMIAHQGRTGNYVVLGWWDRENELPLRVFVSPDARPQSWRVSQASESICVWDLEVIWAERQAYVKHVLGSAGSDPEMYLSEHM